MKTEGRKDDSFGRRLLAEWRRLVPHADAAPVVLAVSGGADSVALLHAFDELVRAGRLGAQLVVAHLDHGLRGEAGEADARWVAELARSLGHEAAVGRADVSRRALDGRDNLEQAARRERYEFLGRVARERGASAVLTAHTLDDQAETVLLRLLRGSGSEGLGGIRPARTLDAQGGVVLLRPLLAWARRADTERFCRARAVEFRVDAMNADERFARVRVRRQLMPLLETFNPRAAEALARTAGLLRADASALGALAAELLAEAGAGETEEARTGEACPAAGPVRVDVLAGAPAALRRRALRLWIARGRGDLRRLEMAHVLAVERLLEGARGGRVAELPGGSAVERRRGRLVFRGEKAN